MARAIFPAIEVTMAVMVASLLLQTASAQEEEEYFSSSVGQRRNNTCTAHRDCDLCIQTQECAWCKDSTVGGAARCDLRDWWVATKFAPLQI